MSESQPTAAAFDVAEFGRTLWRRKWLLLLPWITALAIGLAAAFLLKPVYVSHSLLRLDQGQSMQGPLGEMSGGGEIEQQAEIMREQMQSSSFLRAVINATGLEEDPVTRAWALEKAAPSGSLTPDERVENFLVGRLRSSVNIRRSKGRLFDITVEDFVPDRARRLADGIANQFVLISKSRQMDLIRAQQEFSSDQLRIYKQELDAAIARLEVARRSAVASQITGSSVNATNLTFATSLVEQAGIEVEDLRQRLQDLRGQGAARLRDNDPALLGSPEASTLASQIVALEANLGRAMLAEGSVGGGSGVRLLLARKSAELEAELHANAQRALPTLAPEARDLAVRIRLVQNDLAAKESWRAWIVAQVSQYQRQIVSTPDVEMDISKLNADVEAARTLYNSFQQQSAAASIREAFEKARLSGRFVVMEPANLPLAPAKPNKTMLVVLAFLIGGVAGMATVLGVEQQDQSMRNADEVESVLGLPVLGAVPRVPELQRSPRRGAAAGGSGAPAALAAPRDHGLIHRLKVESPLGLEFRRIYLNLARARGRVLPRTIMLTSSTRGEGKTTTSACLGITLAREHRQRTLLVDFDLRSPTLHRALGMPGSSWGLAQMLHHRNFDERFVRQTSSPELDFLSAGRSERPAAELVDQESVEWFLREAQSRYELIVIDTAPNLAVPDPLILGRAVEGVIYVIKAGATIRRAAEYGVRIQREARDNLVGVLMNDVGEYLPQYYGYKSNYYGYTSESAG